MLTMPLAELRLLLWMIMKRWFCGQRETPDADADCDTDGYPDAQPDHGYGHIYHDGQHRDRDRYHDRNKVEDWMNYHEHDAR